MSSEQLIQAVRFQEPIGEMIGDERVEPIHRDRTAFAGRLAQGPMAAPLSWDEAEGRAQAHSRSLARMGFRRETPQLTGSHACRRRAIHSVVARSRARSTPVAMPLVSKCATSRSVARFPAAPGA